MRRALFLFFAFVALARPVSADDGIAARQQDLKQSLAAASAAVTSLDQRLGALQAQIDQTQLRVDRERDQVRMLARAVYAQPSSPLLMVLSAGSLSDALTRLSDTAVATDRATATRRALDGDLQRLRTDRVAVQTTRDREGQLLNQLDKQFRELEAILAAAAAAPAAPTAPAAPARLAITIPTNPSQIQQLILTAFSSLGPEAQAWALRVAKCESGYNPNAVNRYSGASGLFQFMPSTWTHTPFGGQSVFDPVANAEAAAWYYNATGRTGGPWSCK